MLNILGGHLKGMKLKVPTQGTRPTSVMLRRKLFDQFIQWEEIIFIDLCAGSGSMGIEALSRGAREVQVIEKFSEAYKLLKVNTDLAASRMPTGSILKVFKWDYQKALVSTLQNLSDSSVVYFYFDPPYELAHLYDKLAEICSEYLEQSAKAFWWIESDHKKGYSIEQITAIMPLKRVKVFEQGSKFIACFSGAK